MKKIMCLLLSCLLMGCSTSVKSNEKVENTQQEWVGSYSYDHKQVEIEKDKTREDLYLITLTYNDEFYDDYGYIEGRHMIVGESESQYGLSLELSGNDLIVKESSKKLYLSVPLSGTYRRD